MSGYSRHLFEQGRGLKALLGLLTSSKAERAPVSVPGPESIVCVPPPTAALMRDFVRFAGGDPSSYSGIVPPHLFSQWSLPAMLAVAKTLPYPATKVINAGCKLRVLEPLPAGESLIIRARLTEVDDNGQRALITISVNTGCASVPEALEAELRVYVPLARPKGDGASKRRSKPRVPEGAQELLYQRIGADAGFDFACLTGDLNPIHWLSPYAKLAGFRRVILHGFGSFAKAFEGIVRARLAGDVGQLRWLEADFTRPLLLPAQVGLYVHNERELFIGDAPGGAAYLVGRFGLANDAALEVNSSDPKNAAEAN